MALTPQQVTDKINSLFRKERALCCKIENLEENGTLPDQAGHEGEFLSTDGSTAFWDEIPSIEIDDVPTDGSSNAVSSDGVFDALQNSDDRITNLENNEFKVLYWQTISSDSGQISIPSGATIILDDLPGSLDAVVETIISGEPSGHSAVTASGTPITVSSFDTNGNYILSNDPVSYPIALLFELSISALDYSNLTQENIIEVHDLNTPTLSEVLKAGNDAGGSSIVGINIIGADTIDPNNAAFVYIDQLHGADWEANKITIDDTITNQIHFQNGLNSVNLETNNVTSNHNQEVADTDGTPCFSIDLNGSNYTADTEGKIDLGNAISLTDLSGISPINYNDTNGEISIQVANTIQSGYLSSTDWNTFNSKVSTTRTISTTSPLSGGGDLSTNRTFAIAKATTSVDGYLAATDFVIFNNKQAAITTGTTAQYFRGDLSLATFPTNNTSFTNGAGYITASSTDTLTNKTIDCGTF